MKITFDKADFELLEKAQALTERILYSADSGSDLEDAAVRTTGCLDDLIYEMEESRSIIEDECPPCAGDCAECHCEGCIEDEPEAVTAEQLREKVAAAIGVEPKGIEVVTTPTGEELLKAIAEIFGA